MAKQLGSLISNHILGESTTLATCWRIVRRDGLAQGFTSCDRDFIIDSLQYKAATGFTATAFAQESGLSVKNLDLNSVLSDEGISERDLVGGLYDYATVEIFMINWQQPPASLLLNPPEHILMLKGILGEVSATENQFTAEIRSSSQLLQQKIGEITTISCRATFGDARCGRTLTDLTDGVLVTDVYSRRRFGLTSVRPPGFYNQGEITFGAGENNGLKAMVLDWSSNIIQLYEPMPFDIQPGEFVVAVAGCQKTVAACNSYGNILNFQGEPHVPGEDAFLSGNV